MLDIKTCHSELVSNGPVALQRIDNAGKSKQYGRGADHTVEGNGSGQGEEEDERRQDEEHQGKVDHREPPKMLKILRFITFS